MGRMSTWVLIGVFTVTTGCASGQIVTDVHTPSADALSAASNWSGLDRLPAGADVLVGVDPSRVIRGKLVSISDSSLTVTREPSIPRASIQRVTRVQSLSRLRAGKGALIGFGFGVLALAATGGVFWQPMVGDTLLGAGIGAGPAIGVTRQTVVYERR